MELDAFESPICLSLFQGSIFQCKNGHAVCDACRVRIHGTCPSCREPVGDIRCRPLENAIAGMSLPCSFRSHGCTQLLKGTERRRHEEVLCQHAPLACPLHGCAYSGLLLYDHIKDAHRSLFDYEVSSGGSAWRVWATRHRPWKVLLDPVDRRVFLLLLKGGGDVRGGQSLSVVCLGPRPGPGGNELLEYKLEVGGAGEPGELSLSASGSVPCIRSWAGQDPTGGRFLFVPDACWSNFGCLNVKVHVHKSTIKNALGSSSEVDGPFPEVDTHWSSSLVRWLIYMNTSLGTIVTMLVLLVFSAVPVMLALAWKKKTSST